MRTAAEDREVTTLMTEFDRITRRLEVLGLDILLLRCGERMSCLVRRLAELTHPGDNGDDY
jgi:hypothetical protein